VDGPAYGAAGLALISAALFWFSPHFASLDRIAVAPSSTAKASTTAMKAKKMATE
jgi:hypothetical protein